MQRIDPATWKRREISDFFRALDCPFYCVVFRVDVTNLYARAKERGLSVYHSILWASMRSVNGVDEFLYKLRGAEVVRYDFLRPSFVEPTADGLFKIVHVDWLPEESLPSFCARARAAADAQKNFIDYADEHCDDFVYVSCLPWIDFTTLTNETSFEKDDSVPRFTWGKIVVEQDGRRTMAYSVQVNHRLLDGRHVGAFQEALQRELDTL